jgi:hypothetical protein
LDLFQTDEIRIKSYGGVVTVNPAFWIEIAIHYLPPARIKVLGNKEEPYIILGRDILNHFHLLLDGPQLILEIG